MPAYVVLHFDVTNPQGFKRYTDKVGSTVARFVDRGTAKVLVTEAKLSEKLVEGTARSNLVIIEFMDEETIKQLYESEAYQAIIEDRTENTEGWLAFV